MSTVPRTVYEVQHVEPAAPGQLIVKYMSWKKFRDLVTQSAIYFRRIDGFKDLSEGKIPLAVWDLGVPALKAWYNRCKEEIFVSCWNMDEQETSEMWSEYAEGYGVRISTTVESLIAELSNPSLPPEKPYDPKVVAWAEKTGAKLVALDRPAHDGFTLGTIKYIDEHITEIYEVLGEGPSNTVPAFRKLGGYANEHEYRAILRPGSASGAAARSRGEMHVFVPVRLNELIKEIRFAPVNHTALANDVATLLADNGLDIPIKPASLGIAR